MSAGRAWELPAGWTWTTVGQVAKAANRQVDPETMPDATHYTGLEHISPDTGELAPTTVGSARPKSKKFSYTTSHILYGKLRPYLNKVALPEQPGICSTDVVPLEVLDEVDRKYLTHFMRSAWFVEQATSLVAGARLPRLSPRALLATPVPWPPETERKRFVGHLDEIDAAAVEVRAVQRDMLKLAEGTYLRTVGLLAADHAAWPEDTVEDLAHPTLPNAMRTGPFGSALLHSEFVDEGIAVLGIDNAVNNRFRWAERRYVTPEKYEQLRRYTVRPGDVIVTIMGTTGRSAVVPDDLPTAVSTKHLATITLNPAKMRPEVLASALQYDPVVLSQIAAENRGAIMEGLNLGVIKRLRLRVPSAEAQEAWAIALTTIHATEDELAAASAELEDLRGSLGAQAFGMVRSSLAEAHPPSTPAVWGSDGPAGGSHGPSGDTALN